MNKRHRLLSAAAAATLGLAGLIGAAAPAANAATSVVISGAGGSAAATPSSVAGTLLDVTNSYSGAIRIVSTNLTYSGSPCAAPGCVVALSGTLSNVAVSASASGSVVTITDFGGTTIGTFTITYGSGGGSSSDSSSAPAPVIQQFGMPATGTCDEAQPEGLNLAGVSSGGWGVSWAQWMNGGTGGAVCTRTLNYSTVQSKWVVN